MSFEDKNLKNRVIYISGTPCTGKTTLATELTHVLIDKGFNCEFIKINDFAISNGYVDGEDPDKFYKVINIDKLNDGLNKELGMFFSCDFEVKDRSDFNYGYGDDDSNKIAIVEGHLSHLCYGADKMIVLRLNPDVLRGRLADRGYSDSKIYENCEAEALAVCSAEAYEIYGDLVSEIDCGDLSISELVDICLDIIWGSDEYPVGDIDFMDWILTNS